MIGPFLILQVRLAEWLGAGLQTLRYWFDSNTELKNVNINLTLKVFLFQM
jgi:hypothetical protein